MTTPNWGADRRRRDRGERRGAGVRSDEGQHLLDQPAGLRHRITHGRIRKVMRRQPDAAGGFVNACPSPMTYPPRGAHHSI
jgi:hypothetical protein